MTTNLREVRVLVQHRGVLRSAFKLLFTRRDASIYLVPYAPSGKYFYGVSDYPEGAESHEFRFRDQLSAEANPKLSIHDSGQAHIYAADTPKAGPLKTRPLADWTGEHLASVRPDSFPGLPTYEGRLRESGAEQERVVPVDDEVETAVFALFLNAAGESFRAEPAFVVTLTRETLATGPLRLAISCRAHGSRGEGATPGVTVFGGWVPRFPWQEPRAGSQPFLWLRGE